MSRIGGYLKDLAVPPFEESATRSKKTYQNCDLLACLLVFLISGGVDTLVTELILPEGKLPSDQAVDRSCYCYLPLPVRFSAKVRGGTS